MKAMQIMFDSKFQLAAIFLLLFTIFSCENIYPDQAEDGAFIAFSSDRDGDWELYLTDEDGLNVNQITSNDLIDRTPVFSRDGANIVWERKVGDYFQLFMRAIGGNEESQLTFGATHHVKPAFSANDTYLYYLQQNAIESHLHRINMLDFSNENLNFGGYDRDFRCSTVDDLVLLESTNNNNFEIWLYDNEWSNISQSSDYDGSPNFVPGNDAIVFVSIRNNAAGLYKMNLSDRSSVKLNTDNGVEGFANLVVSPDAKYLLFTYEEDVSWDNYVSVLKVINLESQTVHYVSDEGYSEMNAEFSPDGQQVIFESKSDGQWGIFRVDLDGHNRVNLSNAPDANNRSAVYQPSSFSQELLQ